MLWTGSKRHSLQAVELSQRSQTAVQIVSNLPAPSNGGPIYRFLRTRWMAGAAPPKSGGVETNPGPTTLNKRVWICDIMLGSRYPQCATGLNTGCTSEAQVSTKHNTHIPGPAIYTENPDSILTQT